MRNRASQSSQDAVDRGQNAHSQTKKKKYSKSSKSQDKKGATVCPACDTWMKRLLGFEWSDICGWERLVRLMNRPSDPANLAVFRILFGLLMVVDIPQERGLAHADYKWGDPEECRFPLFNFLQVLPIQWMYIVYLVMLVGAVGIMLGFLFRFSCFLFIVTYWYIFLLDKMSWNNHSYLYGLISASLMLSDANRYWSLDGLIWPSIRNAHVPLWNYCLFRTQIFLVYFVAGLKKMDSDWTHGYSMSELSHHWVFMPFTYMMTNEQIDLVVVHWGGLFLDTFIGYFLFFDLTRPFALFFGTSFHIMNSQIFSIGMFPYAMIAADNLFLSQNWPKWLLQKLPLTVRNLRVFPSVEEAQPSSHCIYTKEQIKPDEKSKKISQSGASKSCVPPTSSSFYHQVFTIWALFYICIQCFLPYSHFLTKGYNNWTNGLYGYSWDMMVHSWSTQHVRITYIDRDTGEIGYLNPEAWSRSRKRWSSHADMMKQYSACIASRLSEHNITNVELYFDIWRSLNDRFQQRMFDPRVDILRAEWNPFKSTPWLMPLLTDLSDWRVKLDQIEKHIYNTTNGTDVVFIADFPGLSLENFIQEDLGNTTIEVLKGQVVVELPDSGTNVTLSEEDSMRVPAGEYHNVYTISDTPSCYMYVFMNTTERDLALNLTSYEILKAVKDTQNSTQEVSGGQGDLDAAQVDDSLDQVDPQVKQVYENMLNKKKEIEEKQNRTFIDRMNKFVSEKIDVFKRSAVMTRIAVESIVTGQNFEEVFNTTFGMETSMNDEDQVSFD